MKKETVDLEQFASDMLSFEEETLKLCRDYREGRIFKTEELNLEPANVEDVIEVSCIRDIPDVAFFMMGPVYVTVQVPYSFLDQYTGEVDDIQFLTIKTSPIASGLDIVEEGVVLGTWNDKIQAVDKEQLDNLTGFMCSQVLGRDGKLFGITYRDAMIQDPVLKAKHGVNEDNLLRVRIFLPFTQRGSVIPQIDLRSGEVGFMTQPTSIALKSSLRAVAKAQAELA